MTDRRRRGLGSLLLATLLATMLLVGQETPVAQAQDPEPPDTTFQRAWVSDYLNSGDTAPVEVPCEQEEPDDPPCPDPPATTNVPICPFDVNLDDAQTGDDQCWITSPYEIPEPNPGGGPPSPTPPGTSMTAVIEDSTFEVIPDAGIIGGDVFEFDVTITNTSSDPNAVLTAFAFQSKDSESPALASRIGDKLYMAVIDPEDPCSTATDPGPLCAVKKNGTSQGLYPGTWKGICINSSTTDFIPEFNSGIEHESLECGGARTDTDFDGNPEFPTPGSEINGLAVGETQTVRLRLDSGTTDGALHVVPEGTLCGSVTGTEVTGPNGLTYWQPSIAESATGCTRNVLDGPLEDFGDNKVLADAGGAFDPSFAPAADSFELGPQRFLTFPRPNDAFTDLLGRNHTCGNYGLTEGVCAGNAGGSPEINILDTGDLVAGVQNYAAMLHGFGEFEANADGSPVLVDGQPQRPTEPYGVLCERCGGRPYVPIAEFYVDNSLTDPADQSVTQVMAGGSYGVLGSADQYTATVDPAASGDFKLEVIPEEDPGGAPARQQLGTSATGEFSNLTVVSEGDPGYDGINGGDHIEFDLTIENTSSNPDAYLTAFNYQTKRRGLADIGILDGFTQDRRDVRAADPATFPGVLETCGDDPEQGACWDSTLGIGRFPNVVGNGLLFGQMVWPDADAGREPEPVIPDQVHVDAVSGRTPEPYWLESVKKNGPFAPILQGNSNFICVKSGLFDQDPDADAACGGEPAILTDPTGEPIPGNIATRPGIPARGEPAEVPARLGLPPGEEQTVRIRMEFGDFRGVLLELLPGTLTVGNLARNFDCSDQRELEYCHPELVGQNIGYNPNTSATWLTPANLADVNHVIINQPGDAPTVMNFVEHFGEIMSMADFVPSAEFHAPDTNPELANFCPDGSAAWCSLAEGGMSNVLIRQQVIGQYVPDFAGLGIDTVEPAVEIDSPVDGSSFIRGEQIPGRYRCTDELGGVGVNNTRGCVAPVPAGAPIDTSAGGDYDFTVTATDRAGNGPVELTHSYSVCQHEFNDVRPAFTGGVDWASCLNHMAGFGSEFRADAGITRGAFARLLYSVAGRPDVSGLPPHGLTGVPASLSDAVTWLVANGYDTGFPDGSFRRLQVVRRGHLARVLHLVAGSPEASAPNTFSDVPNRLDDAVSWLTDPANSPRYANGFANGTFRPAQVINRGNTVRVVCRINGPPGLC